MRRAECFRTLSLFLLVNWVSSESSLIQLNALIRHGERTPTETYPNDPYLHYNWTEGWGQLTNGKLQMYELGQHFRKKYKDFIPIYYWPDYVNVTSSYSERCRNSGDLFCAGLFPPKDMQIWKDDFLWQPIPLSYLPRAQDTIFAEVKNSTKVKEVISKYQNLFNYLTEHTGMNVTLLEDVELLFNTLEIEQLHNLTLPNWVNDTLLVTMKEIGAMNLARYSETEYMKRMKGGVFLKTVFSLMDKALAKEKTKILNLYFGHDLTLVHVLRSLNLVDTIKPEFCAYLVFELYSDGKVKIAYTNTGNGSLQIDREYELSALKVNLEPVLPINWNAECQSDGI